MPDFIERLISDRYGLRVVWLDVTETARTLEEKHLSGPAAALVLGEAIAAAGLLSVNLKSVDERISFQMKTDGPVRGVLVEAGGDGAIRGYTDVKVIDHLDGLSDPGVGDALGMSGKLTIIHSNSVKLLSSGTVSLSPPHIRKATARYFLQSEQIPTGVEIHASLRDFRLEAVRGIMVQKLPGADTEKFVEVLERFENRTIQKGLAEEKNWEQWRELLALEDLRLLDRQPLCFGCRCSYEKSAGVLATLNAEELKEIVRAGKGQQVICHFCGEAYRIGREDVERTLLDKAGPKFNA